MHNLLLIPSEEHTVTPHSELKKAISFSAIPWMIMAIAKAEYGLLLFANHSSILFALKYMFTSKRPYSQLAQLAKSITVKVFDFRPFFIEFVTQSPKVLASSDRMFGLGLAVQTIHRIADNRITLSHTVANGFRTLVNAAVTHLRHGRLLTQGHR